VCNKLENELYRLRAKENKKEQATLVDWLNK
jgi:hypothetical protein